MEKHKIRQPIVTVCGHVDHGKTSILDAFRGSSVQSGEAGGITQKISFTSYPIDKLRKAFPIIDKKGIKLEIPGFLLIDTPGHAAFTNLRKRGGNLADLAVLVIDVNEGIKPQTAEVIQILKRNKVPFVIALNKIDNIHGWHFDGKKELKASIESQPRNTTENFTEKYLTLVGSLQAHGFDADLFYNIDDFTKKIALVPCSARTKEGLPELVLMLCGLSERYLKQRLALGSDAKGIMLEVKKEHGNFIEAILYDGTLSRQDEIAVAGFDGKPIISKIRVMEEILPLSAKFEPKDSVKAATGLRIQLVEKQEVLPGMPFLIYKKNKEQIADIFAQQISESIKTDPQGIIAKADSLGSLEALLAILHQEKVSVVKAGIGPINKADISSAKANLEINEQDAIIIGFNVEIDSAAAEIIPPGIKILTDDVVYKLVENLHKTREERAKEIEKNRLMGLATIGKLKLLKQYVFKNTSPAIFGVSVAGGKIASGLKLIDQLGEEVGRIKNMQLDKASVAEAEEGKELAISIPGINYERRMKNVDFMYVDISESQFKTFKKNKDLLSQSELQILQEIAEIKRRTREGWGK